ncbi:MAG: hypothetical protein E2O53_04550 [Gammaproteobacteria bacterium]|nr:MAG: hypothetical protein E2O53_04550 [Gammaproteobacteria bacterium]
MRIRAILAVATFAALIAAPLIAQDDATMPKIDQRSYQLGIMGGFAEVVKLGVKQLALSEVMTPQEMDGVMDDAMVIAKRNQVQMWRETDFLVTDLYPADVAEGKHVLLIYAGNTLDRYLTIKVDKARLVDKGEYEGAAREEIARRFGRLLSYPDAVIDDLLERQSNAN